ncbi:MAG: hypothetical protein ACYC67_21505 [Prosthecobacter sp.]
MSSRSQAILNQIQALPPEEQQEVCDHVMLWVHAAAAVTTNRDPIRSARGMFAGSRLNDALMKHRQEERRRA